eukprot:335209-Amphidinium_carterae.1
MVTAQRFIQLKNDSTVQSFWLAVKLGAWVGLSRSDLAMSADARLAARAREADARFKEITFLRSFEAAPEAVKGNKDVVLRAVRKYPNSLQYAADALKRDADVVLTAVAQDSTAL